MKRSSAGFKIAFLAPAVLLYAFFVLYPLAQALILSFYRFRGLGGERKFVGIENYQRLWLDETVWKSVVNNLMLAAGCLILILVLAMVIAHWSDRDDWAGKLLRSIYLFPHVVSIVIVAILWKFIFHPTIGPLAPQYMEKIGWEDSPVWTGQSETALASVGIAFTWWALGFYIMVLAAGLRGIPQDVKEAAELDGSTGIGRFISITWALLWSVRRIVVVHVVIATLNTFALVYLMTNGGPDRASEVTLSYLYERGIQQSVYGEATGIAIINLFLVLVITGIIMLMFRRNPVEARK